MLFDFLKFVLWNQSLVEYIDFFDNSIMHKLILIDINKYQSFCRQSILGCLFCVIAKIKMDTEGRKNIDKS